MHFKLSKELPTANGQAYVNPASVVLVLPVGSQCQVMLESGLLFDVTLSAEDAANTLWRFSNQASNGGFFNPDHVQALIPNGSGCKMVFPNNSSFDSDQNTKVMMELLRTANEARNAIVGTP